MKDYESITWDKLNENGRIVPISGVNAVISKQAVEYLGTTKKLLEKARNRASKELKALGMFTKPMRDMEKVLDIVGRTPTYEYIAALTDGGVIELNGGLNVYYTAPAIARIADELKAIEAGEKANSQCAVEPEPRVTRNVEKVSQNVNNGLEIINIDGIDCYEKDDVAYLKLETVARGLGFTEMAASGNECIRWRTVRKYLADFGIATSCDDEKLPDYIPENIFYRLAMKAKNAVAEVFQAKIADEVIPSIRKHGMYVTNQKLHEIKIALENRVSDLEDENSMLAKETQTWDNKKQLIRLVREYAYYMCGANYKAGWYAFYRELAYKKLIFLKARPGEGKLIDKIQDDEWPDVLSVAASMCRGAGIDLTWAINATNAAALEEREAALQKPTSKMD